MTKYNTGNPVGSADPRDLYDNAQVFDEQVNNVSSPTVNDRFGRARVTLANQLGYNLKGDYSAGIELNSYNDIIRYSGEFYGPAASATLPYTTTATLPDADGNLVARGDLVLRQDLSSSSPGFGAALVSMQDGSSVESAVNGRVANVESVSEGFAALSSANGYQYSVKGWVDGSKVGGGRFYFSSSEPKANHDGISKISPTVPPVSAQAGATFEARRDNFLLGAGETDGAGTGVFIALDKKNANVYAGLSPDSAETGTVALQALIDYASANSIFEIDLEPGEYITGALTGTDSVDFVGRGAVFNDISYRVSAKNKKGLKKFSLPAGLSWAPFSEYYLDENGVAHVDFDVKDHALATESPSIVSLYVDYENGNDADSGTTSAPRKTIASAFGLKSAGVIWLKDGIHFNTSNMVMDSTYTKPFLQIKSWSGKPVTIWNGPDPAGLSFSVTGGTSFTYEANTASCFGVFDRTILDDDGRYKPLVERANSTEVNNNPGSWYFDSGTTTLYVRRYTNEAPGTDLLVQSNGGITVQDGKALYLENVIWQSGNPVKAYDTTGVKPRFYMLGGELSYALNFGLDADGADTFIQDAVGFGCGLDNFNYHENSGATLDCNSVEINVTSYGSGSLAQVAPENKNGSSMHDNGNIIRINGQYHGNFGPNVIDTTNGVSLNVGTLAENSIAPTGSQNRNFSIGASGFVGTMYCHATKSKRSVNDYYAEGGGSELNVSDALDSGVFVETNAGDSVKQYWP